MVAPSILWLDAVDSTQRVAGECVLRGDRRYEVVCARHQTMGRGRKGAVWYDEPDTSLLTSLILWDEVPPEPVGLLGMVGAIAVVETVRNFLRTVNCEPTLLGVKYPNDVLWDQRKIAGILVEIVQNVPIVGIGINIARSHFPPELQHKAISIYQVAGQPTSEQFLHQRTDWITLLYLAFQRWNRVVRENPNAFYRQWCQFDRSAGRIYRVLGQAEDLVGVALGVAPDFRLRLRLEEGDEITTYYVESLENS